MSAESTIISYKYFLNHQQYWELTVSKVIIQIFAIPAIRAVLIVAPILCSVINRDYPNMTGS